MLRNFEIKTDLHYDYDLAQMYFEYQCISNDAYDVAFNIDWIIGNINDNLIVSSLSDLDKQFISNELLKIDHNNVKLPCSCAC